MAKKTVSRLEVYIEENFDIREMTKIGFFQTKDPTKFNYIKNSKDYEAIAARIKHFFGLKSIYDYSHIMETKPEPKLPEYVSCKEWITEDQRLLNLLENN